MGGGGGFFPGFLRLTGGGTNNSLESRNEKPKRGHTSRSVPEELGSQKKEPGRGYLVKKMVEGRAFDERANRTKPLGRSQIERKCGTTTPKRGFCGAKRPGFGRTNLPKTHGGKLTFKLTRPVPSTRKKEGRSSK